MLNFAIIAKFKHYDLFDRLMIGMSSHSLIQHLLVRLRMQKRIETNLFTKLLLLSWHIYLFATLSRTGDFEMTSRSS